MSDLMPVAHRLQASTTAQEVFEGNWESVFVFFQANHTDVGVALAVGGVISAQHLAVRRQVGFISDWNGFAAHVTTGR